VSGVRGARGTAHARACSDWRRSHIRHCRA